MSAKLCHSEKYSARADGVGPATRRWRLRTAPGRLSVLLFTLTVCPGARPQDLQVTATVGADVVGVQDNFQLTITVSGRDSNDAEVPRLPRFHSFRVVAGPSVSTSYQWINGRSSSSKSFIYVLLPEKEGEYTLDPVEVSVGGKVYKTQPVAVRVTAASSAPPPARDRISDPFAEDDIQARRSIPGGEEVFVLAEPDRTTVYVGQQVTLAYHLLTQVGVTGLQLQESPPLTGFWVEDLKVDPNPNARRRFMNGREYLDYAVKKQALFPNSPGRVTIEPSTFAISVRTPGDIFGFLTQAQTVYRKTREVEVTVKPLPREGRPAQFNGAVGSFSLTSSLDRKEAATGDAVALVISLAGKGNLKTVPDPALPPMPDFTIYSSKRSEQARPADGDAVAGEKTWEYVVVPKAPGSQKIPSLSLSYFDPDRDRYVTLTTPELELKVQKGGGSDTLLTGLSGMTKQNLKRQGSDINFIKLSTADLRRGNQPIFHSTWFYLAAGIPLLVNVGAYLYQRERRRESSDLVLARSRRARRTALRRMKEAEKAGRVDPRRFYDGAALALSRYLTDRFNLPEIAVTADSLEKSLAERSVDPRTAKEVMDCLQRCDYGRFVSASGSPDQMRDLLRKVRSVIETLERS